MKKAPSRPPGFESLPPDPVAHVRSGTAVAVEALRTGLAPITTRPRRVVIPHEDEAMQVGDPDVPALFKPYAGVSSAILVFTKTNSGGTDFVWFYDVDADGRNDVITSSAHQYGIWWYRQVREGSELRWAQNVIDDTWTQAHKIMNREDASAPPQVAGTTEYTLDEVTKKRGKKVASILGKSRTKVNLSSAAGPVTGNVNGESETLVSVDDGLVLEMRASSDFAGTMGPGKGSRAQSLELKRIR